MLKRAVSAKIVKLANADHCYSNIYSTILATFLNTGLVGLLRFGGVLTLTCVVGGVDFVLRHRVAGRAEARFACVGIEIVVDCGERAKEKTADVGEGGGSARGDASLRQQGVEGAEGMVDALRVLEAAGFLGQGSQEVGVVLVQRRSVIGAEPGGIVAGEGAALTSGGGAMLTTGGADARAEVGFHGFVLLIGLIGSRGYPTPGVLRKEFGFA